jgi:MIP family channel proteins
MKTKAYIAEMVGTFIFFVIGAGAICTDSLTHGGVGLIGIALAHGLILAIVVSCFGAISGGHVNPAVTIGLLVSGKICVKDSIAYIIAQLIGGVCAGLVLVNVFPESTWRPVNLGTPDLAAGVTWGTGIFLEAVMTFFLLISVFMTAVDSRAPKIGGFAIGLTVLVDILLGGPITGASMNPARTFGPAVVANHWNNHMVYWIGPIIGAVIAGILYRTVFAEKE